MYKSIYIFTAKIYFTVKLSTRDMKTPVGFWEYLEGTSLNINRGDTLIRMSLCRTFLRTIETKSVEATRIFPICCCLAYSTPYRRLLQREAHRTDQNVCVATSNLEFLICNL
jgi:hypothetical protein